MAVNPAGTRVYVTHLRSESPPKSRLKSLSVIDTASYTVMDTAFSAGASGVALNPAGNRVYVTDEFSDKASVLDVDACHTVIATVAVGRQPLGVAVNPAGTPGLCGESNLQ